MGGGVVATKLPGAEQETDDPGVCIRSRLGGTLIDAVVESCEDEAGGLESARYGHRKPDPEEEEEDEKDGNGNAEISPQPNLTADVWDQSDDETGDDDKPKEPGLVKDVGVRVVDLKGGDQEVCGALLSAGDGQNPGRPIPPL